jgi:hypothetical protein
MADAKTETGAAPKKKKAGKLGFYTTLVFFVLLAPFIFPTIVLLFIGLIPTMIAFFVDTDNDKSSAAAIGAMNFAGISPFVIDLWVNGQSMQTVFQILHQSSSWLVMLGAAAVGQLIVFAIPQAMASLTLASAEIRLKILKKNMETLKATWGNDVATTKPLDKLAKME